MQAASEHTTLGCFRAVSLPKNAEQLPVEITLSKGGGSAYLEEITKALGLQDPRKLLVSR